MNNPKNIIGVGIIFLYTVIILFLYVPYYSQILIDVDWHATQVAIPTKEIEKELPDLVDIAEREGCINNNPGNLVFANQAYATRNGRWALFDTMEHGIDALKRQIQLDTDRRDTLYVFLSAYAPESENDLWGYINFISLHTGIEADTWIGYADVDELIVAIIKMEC